MDGRRLPRRRAHQGRRRPEGGAPGAQVQGPPSAPPCNGRTRSVPAKAAPTGSASSTTTSKTGPPPTPPASKPPNGSATPATSSNPAAGASPNPMRTANAPSPHPTSRPSPTPPPPPCKPDAAGPEPPDPLPHSPTPGSGARPHGDRYGAVDGDLRGVGGARRTTSDVDGLRLAVHDEGARARWSPSCTATRRRRSTPCPLFDRLPGGPRLVTLDLPGFGASAKPPDHPYSIHGATDAVEAVWAAAGRDRRPCWSRTTTACRSPRSCSPAGSRHRRRATAVTGGGVVQRRALVRPAPADGRPAAAARPRARRRGRRRPWTRPRSPTGCRARGARGGR